MDNRRVINMRAIKREELKKKVISKAIQAREWYLDHWQEVVLVGVPAIQVGRIAIKVIGKRANLHKEQDLKDKYVYDRRLGHYWELKRKLSNEEWIEIQRRHENGECLGEILRQLGALKI